MAGGDSGAWFSGSLQAMHASIKEPKPIHLLNDILQKGENTVKRKCKNQHKIAFLKVDVNQGAIIFLSNTLIMKDMIQLNFHVNHMIKLIV
jgi:hypothetical protein